MCEGRYRKNQFQFIGQPAVLLIHRRSMGRHPSADRSWHFFSRPQYNGVVYHRRTADFSETIAASEEAASTNFNMLNLISMSNARSTLKKGRTGSKMIAPLRMVSASVNCVVNVGKVHWMTTSFLWGCQQVHRQHRLDTWGGRWLCHSGFHRLTTTLCFSANIWLHGLGLRHGRSGKCYVVRRPLLQ